MAKIIDPDDLSYSINSATNMLRFDMANKTIQLVAGGALVAQDGVTLQAVYSKCKDVWKADATAIKYPFPIYSVTEEMFELQSGWDWYDDTTRKMLRDAGWAVLNTSGVVTQEWAGIITLGAISSAATAYYVQSSATNATTTNFTYTPTAGVNEAIQIYRDDDGDGNTSEGSDYNRRSYFKLFLREQGKTYGESANADIGASALTYKAYRFPLTNADDLKITHADNLIDSDSNNVPDGNYAGMTITYYATAQQPAGLAGGPYNFGIVIDANNRSATEVYEYVQWALRRTVDVDAGAGDRTGRVMASLLRFVGDNLYTIYQTSNAPAGGGGVFIANLANSSRNTTYFADNTAANRQYPLTTTLRINFNDNLQADSTAKYWVFFTTLPGGTDDFGQADAVIVDDADNVDMTGLVNAQAYVEHSFAYTTNNQGGRTANTDAAVTVVAIGESGAKYVVASGTITSSPSVVSLVAELERNYIA